MRRIRDSSRRNGTVIEIMAIADVEKEVDTSPVAVTL